MTQNLLGLVSQGNPSYLRVAQTLISDIEAGRYPVESLLPTEHELAAQFGMSRHTIREAIRRLQGLGLVTRQQGVGTRVKASSAAAGYVQKAATIADLTQYARDVELKINSIDDAIADAALAERLICRKGQRWLHLAGLRYQTGQDTPISFTEVYINYEFASVRDRLGKDGGAIYRLLEDHFGLRITDVQQKISAVPIAEDVAEKLGVQTNAPGLSIARYYRTSDGRLVEAAFSIYRADSFTYEVRLTLDTPAV